MDDKEEVVQVGIVLCRQRREGLVEPRPWAIDRHRTDDRWGCEPLDDRASLRGWGLGHGFYRLVLAPVGQGAHEFARSSSSACFC